MSYVGDAHMRTSVDVVIPCYNYGKFLTESVNSILCQEDVDIRILIIDDCSPDNTQEIGERLASIHECIEFRRHTFNKGHIETYNEGIEWANSDLFLLLSADDYILPGSLGRAAKIMADRPDLSFVFGSAILQYDEGALVRNEPLSRYGGSVPTVLSCHDFVQALGGQNIVPTPTAVVRTSAQKQTGGYSKELPHAGDLAMWLLLAAAGPVGFINEPQAVYRIHAQNMSRAYLSVRLPDIQQRLAAFELFLQEGGRHGQDVELLRQVLMSDLARESLSQACLAFNEGDTEVALELERLAHRFDPGVRFSVPWFRLLLRTTLGEGSWRRARSINAAFKQVRLRY
jgi:hypothetical protein